MEASQPGHCNEHQLASSLSSIDNQANGRAVRAAFLFLALINVNVAGSPDEIRFCPEDVNQTANLMSVGFEAEQSGGHDDNNVDGQTTIRISGLVVVVVVVVLLVVVLGAVNSRRRPPAASRETSAWGRSS